MPIPTTKSNPTFELGRKLTLIYGDPKIGKSTLASEYPKACFIATEAGLSSLSVIRWETEDGRYVVQSWEELCTATAEIIASKQFDTIVIDTIGNAFLLCETFICNKNGEEYKSDGKLGYGKGSALVANELRRYFTKLSALGVGVVLVGHAMQKTVTTRTGEIQKRVPFVPCDNKTGDLYNMLLGMCDLVLFCDNKPNGERVIRTKPDANYDAGDRSGRLPAEIPLIQGKTFSTIESLMRGKVEEKKPVEKKQPDPKPVDTKPAEKAADSKPAESKPAESKTTPTK